MAYVEIFEFSIRPNNTEAFEHSCRAFRFAALAIEGLDRMDFLIAQDDASVAWQQIQWRDQAARLTGTKRFWALPEMGLFSLFIKRPPVRVRDFLTA